MGGGRGIEGWQKKGRVVRGNTGVVLYFLSYRSFEDIMLNNVSLFHRVV